MDGNLNVSRFNNTQGLYFDNSRNQLLISDYGNNRFKVLDFNCKKYWFIDQGQARKKLLKILIKKNR